MPGSKAKKLRKAYEFKLGKSLVSKLSDDQINLLSKFYNSLSESEQSDIDNKIFKGHTDTDLHEMAEAFYQEQVENKESKETPKQTPTKSSAIVSSNFFGKDRYEKYLGEINSQGTIEGHQLTPQERKEAFKSRKNKINFETFVDKVLEKKVAAASVSNTKVSKSLMGGGTLATVENIKNTVNQSVSTGEDYTEILGKIDEIIDVLKKEQKLKEKIENTKRKEKEKRKRKGAESNLEKGFKAARKAVQKVVAPVKGILDRIINFFLTVLMGRAVVKLIDWFSDEKNKSKVDSIFRFLGENWPKLLALFLVFKTGLGKFARSLIRLVIKGTARLVAATAALLARVVGGKIGGKLGKFGKFLGGKKGKLLTAGLEVAAVTGGTMLLGNQIENVFKVDSPPEEGEETKTQNYKGGGMVFPQFKMPSFLHLFKGSEYGGEEDQSSEKPQGYVSGEKGVDKIPAMLSDGEFVMSVGAVERYGIDTLESMNAAGGGDNKPKVKGGKIFAAGGGLINPRAKTIFNLLVNGGMSPVAAGGIVANIGTETGYTYDPTTKQGGGGPGRGLAQWEKGGRYDTDNINLLEYAKSRNKSWEDLATQVNFILHEMMYHPEYIQVKKRMNKAQDINEATRIFLLDYEKAGTPHMDRRLEVAKQIQGSDWFKSKGKSWLEEKFKSQFFPKSSFFSGGLVEGNNLDKWSKMSRRDKFDALMQHREGKMKSTEARMRYLMDMKSKGLDAYGRPLNIIDTGSVRTRDTSNIEVSTRSQKGLPSIPPPMSSNVQVEYVPMDAMKGNSPPVAASSYGGSDIPSFSASAPGPDYKRQTLGITQ